MKKKDILELIHDREGWEVKKKGGKEVIELFGQDFPVVHPVSIWSKLYRITENPDLKYQALINFHNYLWPDLTYWNHWTERRFREHCAGHSVISWAGGSSIGKSYDAAKLGLLFWLADPENRGLIIASTTLDSMESRVWGYLTGFITSMEIPYPIKYVKSKPPKVLFKNLRKDSVAGIEGRQGAENIDDTIHGIFAAAAKKGDDQTAINTWIGRHPRRGLMVILDECPDLPIAIMGSLPNLEAQQETFQVLALGNSADKFDLHGSLSTPLSGWDNISPLDYKWQTTQKNGICLYFNPYDSPAIVDPDPERRRVLSKIFPTEKDLDEKKKHYGEKSVAFQRFVLGYWKEDSSESVIISDSLIKVFDVEKLAEWSGIMPLRLVAGLDPAFSSGGDSPVLRLAILGHDTQGNMVLDYQKEKLLFKLKIDARSPDPAELQLAKQTTEILNKYNIPMSDLAIDSTGQGRALSEVLRLYAKSIHMPIKIYSVLQGSKRVKSFDVIIKSAYELWMSVREFIQTNQIRGLDGKAVTQLTTRLVETRNNKQVLETKASYRARMTAIHSSWGSSPDEADAAALALQVAILKYGLKPGLRYETPQTQDTWSEKIRLMHGAQAQQQMGSVRVNPPTASFSGNLESLASNRKLF